MTKAKVYHDGAVSGARRAVDAVMTVLLAALCIVWIYPVLLILLNSLKAELANPEMRRLMELPGMRMGDAYRLAHYNDALRQTAQTVEQGVVERIRQRSARPAENGTSPGGAAITRADVASMTRAQREALERRAMHGVKISF